MDAILQPTGLADLCSSFVFWELGFVFSLICMESLYLIYLQTILTLRW